MGVVGTVVVEADALVWNSDCRVAPARTLVLFPPSRFFRLCRCGALLRGSTFPGNRLWAHVCSESCAHLSARAWYIRIGWCLPMLQVEPRQLSRQDAYQRPALSWR